MIESKEGRNKKRRRSELLPPNTPMISGKWYRLLTPIGPFICNYLYSTDTQHFYNSEEGRLESLFKWIVLNFSVVKRRPRHDPDTLAHIRKTLKGSEGK